MYFAAKASGKAAAKAGSSSGHHIIPGWLLHFGAAGVFGVALVDSCPFPLPVPGSTDLLILILGASGEWPWFLALCGVAGSIIGGLITWSTGKKGGEAMLDHYMKKRRREQITRWIRGHGVRSVIVATLLPPPIPLLPFLLTAGALGVTKKQLIIALGLGRGLRYGAEAALATLYGDAIIGFWRKYLAGYSHIILYTFLGLIAAGILFGIWKWKHDKHRRSDNQEHQPKTQAA